MVVEAGGDGAHDGEAGEAGRGPTLVAVLFMTLLRQPIA